MTRYILIITILFGILAIGTAAGAERFLSIGWVFDSKSKQTEAEAKRTEAEGQAELNRAVAATLSRQSDALIELATRPPQEDRFQAMAQFYCIAFGVMVFLCFGLITYIFFNRRYVRQLELSLARFQNQIPDIGSPVGMPGVRGAVDFERAGLLNYAKPENAER